MTSTTIYRNPQTKTTEQFIIDAKKIHGDKYDYSLVDYINAITKVKIICSIHGEFEQTPSNHLRNHGCLKCRINNSRIIYSKNKEKVLSDFKKIHKNKYDYTKFSYINAITKSDIYCKKCKSYFKQASNVHLKGHGCPKCGNENNNFLLYNKHDNLKIYLIRCWNDSEEFLKIGITSRTTDKRYSNKTLMPYRFEIIYEFQGDSETIFNIERHIKKNFIKYNPFKKFSGITECLDMSQYNIIIDYINENQFLDKSS